VPPAAQRQSVSRIDGECCNARTCTACGVRYVRLGRSHQGPNTVGAYLPAARGCSAESAGPKPLKKPMISLAVLLAYVGKSPPQFINTARK